MGFSKDFFHFFFLIFLSRSSPPPRLFPFFKLNKSWLCLEMSHWSCSLTFVLPTVVLFAVNMTPSSERCSKSHLDRPIQLCLPHWAKEPIAQCEHSALSRDFVRERPSGVNCEHFPTGFFWIPLTSTFSACHIVFRWSRKADGSGLRKKSV